MKIKRLHIILAGGKAERFGILPKGVNKTFVPLGQTTLLHRQITQSISSGNSQIYVATSWLYAKKIKSAIDSFPQVKVNEVPPGRWNDMGR